MKQHTTPCAACPWRRDNKAAGYLGSATPGQFLQSTDAGVRMPCHSAVDYERTDWRAQAERAPECAGAAIHRSNRAASKPGLLKLPADREAVFNRPHEFIAHHTRQPPEELAATMIYELYQL